VTDEQNQNHLGDQTTRQEKGTLKSMV
jgi:hypothetical protein